MQDLQPVSRASSNTMLVGRLQSATTVARLDSADLPELTDADTIHKVVKKIRGMYNSCSTGDSQDVMHMLGSIQVDTLRYHHWHVGIWWTVIYMLLQCSC